MFKYLLLSAFAIGLHAEAAVVRLGATQLRPTASRIVIDVPNTCGVSHIQAVSTGRSHVTAVIVDYVNANAPQTRFAINRNFNNNQGTGWLALPGVANRCVSRVIVNARSLGPQAARITIFANVPAGGGGGGGGGAARLIGTTNLQTGINLRFVSVAPVCDLNDVRIRVLNNPASINFMTVRFTNGQSQRLELRQNFAAGSFSAWKDLAGNNRCINGFFVVGSSTGGGAARVQLQGR